VVKTEEDLWHAVLALGPQLIMYAMSFMALGLFWVGQQTQLNQFARADRHLAWIHIGFLFSVSVMPFSTRLLAEFIRFRLALFLYWINLFSLGAVLFVSWKYASRTGLLKPNLPTGMSHAIERRIVIAQGLYAASMLLCLKSTYLSISLIVLLQLNYAIAPGLLLERRKSSNRLTTELD
jgi:uncharacterized membrane protein